MTRGTTNIVKNSANFISYESTTTNLKADDVQTAIDKLARGAGSVYTPPASKYDSIYYLSKDNEKVELNGRFAQRKTADDYPPVLMFRIRTPETSNCGYGVIATTPDAVNDTNWTYNGEWGQLYGRNVYFEDEGTPLYVWSLKGWWGTDQPVRIYKNNVEIKKIQNTDSIDGEWADGIITIMDTNFLEYCKNLFYSTETHYKNITYLSKDAVRMTYNGRYAERIANFDEPIVVFRLRNINGGNGYAIMSKIPSFNVTNWSYKENWTWNDWGQLDSRTVFFESTNQPLYMWWMAGQWTDRNDIPLTIGDNVIQKLKYDDSILCTVEDSKVIINDIDFLNYCHKQLYNETPMGEANTINFNNKNTTLQATNVQDAINELAAGGSSVNIIDNLTSDDSTAALSARQGAVLNNKFNDYLATANITVSDIDIGEGAELQAGHFYFVYE